VVSCFFLPAAIYILGWFYYLPESLGAPARSPRPLRERWNLWLRASGLLGLASLLGWGVSGILAPAPGLPVALAYGVLTAYLVAVVMVLLRRHFAPEGGKADSTLGSAQQPWVRAFEKIGAPARHLANCLSPRVSLPSGSMLVLASVLLVTSMNVGCHDTPFRGYEVLQGKGAWLTAENMGQGAQQAVAKVAGYANYNLGLAAALIVAIVLVIRQRRRDVVTPRLARWLVFTTGAATLFTISDLAFFVSPETQPFVYCLLMLVYWAAPVAAWLYYAFAGRKKERWPMVRSSLIILYLPVLLWSYGFLILVALIGVYGYLSYFFGIQLAWWGSIQLASAENREPPPVDRD
jgi:hypothetical protein